MRWAVARVRAGERVEQRGLAAIRVPEQRHLGQTLPIEPVPFVVHADARLAEQHSVAHVLLCDGDTPLIGAGGWADHRVAVSCTGQGEYFVRVAAAAQLAHRVRFGGQSLAEAAGAVLAEIRALGGEGGLIAVDADGNDAMPFVSAGMKRAALLPNGEIVSEAF